MSNMYAMNLARYRHFPEIKELGNSAAPRLAVFTSQEVWFLIYNVSLNMSQQKTSIEIHSIKGSSFVFFFLSAKKKKKK